VEESKTILQRDLAELQQKLEAEQNAKRGVEDSKKPLFAEIEGLKADKVICCYF